MALVARLSAAADAFNRAKVWAVAGLTVGFGVWCFGFLVVAGEYLAMWQSRSWNGQEAAFRLTMVILGVSVTGSCGGRVGCASGCPTIGAGIVSASGVEKAAAVPAAPNDHFTAGPDCRVRSFGHRRVGGAGGCPTIGWGCIFRPCSKRCCKDRLSTRPRRSFRCLSRLPCEDFA